MAVLWVDPIITTISGAIFVVSLVVDVWAFIHCATQRSDAFDAVGTMAKNRWLLLIGGTLVLSFLLAFLSLLFSLIALAASLVYLLDVRPAIRDVINGSSSSW